MHEVLLVEDDELIRLTLAEYLRDEGLRVVEAQNDVEALAALSCEPPPTIVVTDLHLAASRDGLYVAQTARRISPEIGVIFITGRPDALAGHSFHLQERLLAKPFRPAELLTTMRQLGTCPL